MKGPALQCINIAFNNNTSIIQFTQVETMHKFTLFNFMNCFL